MAHDDQVTAVGPPLAGSGFPRSGFSTKATGMVHGRTCKALVLGSMRKAFEPRQDENPTWMA